MQVLIQEKNSLQSRNTHCGVGALLKPGAMLSFAYITSFNLHEIHEQNLLLSHFIDKSQRG